VRIDTDGHFHDFVMSRTPDLARLARLLSSDAGAAEDLVQVTLLRAWRSWPRVTGAADPDAYVRRIMVNAAVSGWRRRWRAEIPSGAVPLEATADPYQQVDDRDYLVRTVRTLPVRQRAAIVLRYFADLDDTAIADALGCSIATVRSQISRALARLRVTASDPSKTPRLAEADREREPS
jgi:RNA polymerase sigma-70 factor (sigma-E family)